MAHDPRPEFPILAYDATDPLVAFGTLCLIMLVTAIVWVPLVFLAYAVLAWVFPPALAGFFWVLMILGGIWLVFKPVVLIAWLEMRHPDLFPR